MQKTLTRIIGEGTAWTTVSTILVKVVSLTTIFIMLRTLSVYEYGVAELAIAAVGFFSIFQLPGLTSVVVADIGVEKGKGNISLAKGLFWSYVRLASLMAVLAAAILFFGAEAIATFYPEHIASYFRILAWLFPLSVVGTSFGALFAITFRYFEQSLSTLLQESIKLIVMVVGFSFFHLKVEAVLYGMVISQALTFLLLLVSAVRAYQSLGREPATHVSLWRTIYEHGKWSIFSTYVGSLGNNIRTYLVKVFLGTEAVALMAVATGLIGHTSALFPIGSVVAPIIPQYISDKERFLRIITKAVKYQVIGYGVLAIVAATLFPPIIVGLFPKYEAAIPLYRIMLFSLLPVGVMSVFTAVFFAFRAQRNLFFAIIMKTFYSTVFTAIGASIFFLHGVALAYVCTLYLYAFERYRRVRVLVPTYHPRALDFFRFDDLDQIILGKMRGSLLRIFLPFLKKKI